MMIEINVEMRFFNNVREFFLRSYFISEKFIINNAIINRLQRFSNQLIV